MPPMLLNLMDTFFVYVSLNVLMSSGTAALAPYFSSYSSCAYYIKNNRRFGSGWPKQPKEFIGSCIGQKTGGKWTSGTV